MQELVQLIESSAIPICELKALLRKVNSEKSEQDRRDIVLRARPLSICPLDLVQTIVAFLHYPNIQRVCSTFRDAFVANAARLNRYKRDILTTHTPLGIQLYTKYTHLLQSDELISTVLANCASGTKLILDPGEHIITDDTHLTVRGKSITIMGRGDCVLRFLKRGAPLIRAVRGARLMMQGVRIVVGTRPMSNELNISVCLLVNESQKIFFNILYITDTNWWSHLDTWLFC